MANFDGYDSRDILTRIEEMEAALGEDPFNPDFEDPNEPYDADTREEYESLVALRDAYKGE